VIARVGEQVIASEAKQSSLRRWRRVDCFVAAAKRQFILSAAAGGVEGLLAMTDRKMGTRTFS
jgi:hypothetical protein